MCINSGNIKKLWIKFVYLVYLLFFIFNCRLERLFEYKIVLIINVIKYENNMRILLCFLRLGVIKIEGEKRVLERIGLM